MFRHTHSQSCKSWPHWIGEEISKLLCKNTQTHTSRYEHKNSTNLQTQCSSVQVCKTMLFVVCHQRNENNPVKTNEGVKSGGKEKRVNTTRQKKETQIKPLAFALGSFLTLLLVTNYLCCSWPSVDPWTKYLLWCKECRLWLIWILSTGKKGPDFLPHRLYHIFGVAGIPGAKAEGNGWVVVKKDY